MSNAKTLLLQVFETRFAATAQVDQYRQQQGEQFNAWIESMCGRARKTTITAREVTALRSRVRDAVRESLSVFENIQTASSGEKILRQFCGRAKNEETAEQNVDTNTLLQRLNKLSDDTALRDDDALTTFLTQQEGGRTLEDVMARKPGLASDLLAIAADIALDTAMHACKLPEGMEPNPPVTEDLLREELRRRCRAALVSKTRNP